MVPVLVGLCLVVDCCLAVFAVEWNVPDAWCNVPCASSLLLGLCYVWFLLCFFFFLESPGSWIKWFLCFWDCFDYSLSFVIFFRVWVVQWYVSLACRTVPCYSPFLEYVCWVAAVPLTCCRWVRGLNSFKWNIGWTAIRRGRTQRVRLE